MERSEIGCKQLLPALGGIVAEIRAHLVEAEGDPNASEGLLAMLVDRFGALGGVELDLPPRQAMPRAADLR